MLRAEARRRGVANTAQVVFLSDGAAWAGDIAPECFAGSARILDFYHACERLHQLAAALDKTNLKSRWAQWKRWLLKDQIAKIIQPGRQLQAQGSGNPVAVKEQLGSLERHHQRMLYGAYCSNGWFIGSGVVEAGCRTVVGKRLQQSGRFWSEYGPPVCSTFARSSSASVSTPSGLTASRPALLRTILSPSAPDSLPPTISSCALRHTPMAGVLDCGRNAASASGVVAQATRLILLLIASGVITASGSNWDHWRGPNRNDVVAETSGWKDGQWPLGKPVWTKGVGEGSTSPLIVDGRLYTMGWKDGRDTVFALSTSTGNDLWSASYICPPHSRVAFGDLGLYSGPSSTPEYDAQTGFLYTLSTDGDLHCWDTSLGGRNLWRLNLFDQYHVPRRPRVNRAAQHDYSYTSSPLVHGDWVVVEVGAGAGNLIAFDKRTGKEAWVSESKSPAGQTGGPVPMTLEGVPCLAVLNFDGLLVLRLDRGREGRTVATYPWPTEYANNIATPAVQGNSVILTSDYNQRRIARIDIELREGSRLAWETKEYSKICSPVILDGCIYWVWRQMHCLDFATGKVRWQGGMFGDAASLVITGDGRLIVWANRSRKELVLVDTAAHSPEQYTELASRVLSDGADAYPHLVLADHHLYVKDRTGEISCFEIGAPSPPAAKPGSD